MKKVIPIFLFMIGVFEVHAQDQPLTLNETISIALKNNSIIKSAASQVEAQKQLRKTSIDLPKTEARLQIGQTNSFARDNNLSVIQAIPFSVFGSHASLTRSLYASANLEKAVTENELIFEVKQVYYQLLYNFARNKLLQQQDSIYEGFLRSASLRYKSGETNLLEKTTAEVQRNSTKNNLRKNEAEILTLQVRLKTLLNAETIPIIKADAYTELTAKSDSVTLASNPQLNFSKQKIEVATREKNYQLSKLAPDLLVGFFSQTLIGTIDPETGASANSSTRFNGVEVGLSIPLWFVPQQGRIKAAAYNKQAAQYSYDYNQTALQGQFEEALQQFEKNKGSLAYYKTSALPNADLILKQSQIAFKNGEISYAEFLLGLRNAINIKEEYLLTMNDYNQSIIYLEYLSGNK